MNPFLLRGHCMFQSQGWRVGAPGQHRGGGVGSEPALAEAQGRLSAGQGSVIPAFHTDSRTPPNDASGASPLSNSVVSIRQSFLSSDCDYTSRVTDLPIGRANCHPGSECQPCSARRASPGTEVVVLVAEVGWGFQEQPLECPNSGREPRPNHRR